MCSGNNFDAVIVTDELSPTTRKTSSHMNKLPTPSRYHPKSYKDVWLQRVQHPIASAIGPDEWSYPPQRHYLSDALMGNQSPYSGFHPHDTLKGKVEIRQQKKTLQRSTAVWFYCVVAWLGCRSFAGGKCQIVNAQPYIQAEWHNESNEINKYSMYVGLELRYLMWCWEWYQWREVRGQRLKVVGRR